MSDPVGASVFALELDGVEVAWFLGCDGPRSRTAVVEIEEGGLNDRVHRRPGPTTWAPLVLRVATSVSPALWAWREACREGEHAPRRDGALVLRAEDGSVRSRWALVGMWPLRWSGPELDGGGSALALEELELAVDEVRPA